MTMFNRLHHHAALISGALLLFGASVAANADDIQDATKLFKQGQNNQALDKVNGILANKPKDAQARFLKGLILTEQNKTSEAIKVFSALTEDYPELPEPYNNLAVLFASQGQYDKAKLALEMAIRTHPSYSTAHENLGDIYAKLASQAYDRALQLDRSNTATKTKLAMIQELFATESRGKAAPARNIAAPVNVAANAPAGKPEATKAEPAKPASVATPATAAAGDSNEVIKTVNAWAAAWSAKDVKGYLSFYASDFRTPNGESRGDWERTREERISAPKSIQVGVSNITVKFADGTHAVAQFHQSYRASHLKTTGQKTLVMVNAGGKWLIQEERAK